MSRILYHVFIVYYWFILMKCKNYTIIENKNSYLKIIMLNNLFKKSKLNFNSIMKIKLI
jgi:hypothetical protein